MTRPEAETRHMIIRKIIEMDWVEGIVATAFLAQGIFGVLDRAVKGVFPVSIELIIYQITGALILLTFLVFLYDAFRVEYY